MKMSRENLRPSFAPFGVNATRFSFSMEGFVGVGVVLLSLWRPGDEPSTWPYEFRMGLDPRARMGLVLG